MTVENYNKTVQRTKTFELTNFHCPNCGEKEVWTENGAGDFYEGPALLCTSCKYEFTIPTFRKVNSSSLEWNIINQLKQE